MRTLLGLRATVPDRRACVRTLRQRPSDCPRYHSGIARANARGFDCTLNFRGEWWIQVVEHPLVATKLSILRSKTTAPDEFRRNLQTLAVLLLSEAGQNWEIDTIEVETPLKNRASAILAKPIVLVPILRAGLG